MKILHINNIFAPIDRLSVHVKPTINVCFGGGDAYAHKRWLGYCDEGKKVDYEIVGNYN